MRKSIAIGLCLTLLAGGVVGCSGSQIELVDEPVINYGESQYYTQEDMDAGIEIIKEQMENWDIEYNIQDISYAGDELSALGTLYVKSLTEDYESVECMVFLVDWVCLSDSKYYDKNKLYEDWEWYIMHGDDGEWMFFTNGNISDYIVIEEETTTTATGNILQDLLDELHDSETTQDNDESEQTEDETETTQDNDESEQSEDEDTSDETNSQSVDEENAANEIESTASESD